MRRTFVMACAAAVLAWSGAASAQRLDAPPTRDVYFTFSEPIVVPNQTLPAGKYLFRVITDSRNIVQIYTGDRAKLIGTAMSVGVMRADQPERPEIRLIESSATPAVGTWWYPEMREGWEFVYPREQAMKLAKSAKDSILTTAENVKLEDVNPSDLVRLEPSGQQQPFSAQESRDLSATARVGEVAGPDTAASAAAAAPSAAPAASAQSAQAGRSAQAGQTAQAGQSAQPGQTARAGSTRATLPQTATERPLVGLVGLIALAAAAGALILRRVA